MYEEERKVTISKEDAANIVKFFEHFNIPIPAPLQAQINRFNDNPDSYTPKEQDKLKIELAHAIITCDHELLKDEIFQTLNVNSDKEWFEAQFDRDVEEVFSKKEG